MYWLLVANNSKCKIIQPLQPVQRAESVSFSALGNTWNPLGDPGKAHSTLNLNFVLFFSSHCPAYMNPEGHSILLIFPPVMKYTKANHCYEHPVPNILLTHYSCIRHINWLHALCFFAVNKLYFWRLLLKLHSVAINTPGRTDLAKHKVGENKMCEPMSWEKKTPCLLQGFHRMSIFDNIYICWDFNSTLDLQRTTILHIHTHTVHTLAYGIYSTPSILSYNFLISHYETWRKFMLRCIQYAVYKWTLLNAKFQEQVCANH